MALTTLEKVKNYLGIGSTVDDVLLTRLIESASSFIETWTSRTFSNSAQTDWFDGTGGAVWMFRNYPASAVSSVQINGVDIPASTSPTMRGYTFDDTRLVLRGYTFTPGAMNCVVTYTQNNAANADVEQCCIELVANRYKEKDRIGLVSKGLAGEMTAYSQADMPKAVRAILGNYRKVVPN